MIKAQLKQKIKEETTVLSNFEMHCMGDFFINVYTKTEREKY